MAMFLPSRRQRPRLLQPALRRPQGNAAGIEFQTVALIDTQLRVRRAAVIYFQGKVATDSLRQQLGQALFDARICDAWPARTGLRRAELFAPALRRGQSADPRHGQQQVRLSLSARCAAPAHSLRKAGSRNGAPSCAARIRVNGWTWLPSRLSVSTGRRPGRWATRASWPKKRSDRVRRC